MFFLPGRVPPAVRGAAAAAAAVQIACGVSTCGGWMRVHTGVFFSRCVFLFLIVSVALAYAVPYATREVVEVDGRAASAHLVADGAKPGLPLPSAVLRIAQAEADELRHGRQPLCFTPCWFWGIREYPDNGAVCCGVGVRLVF